MAELTEQEQRFAKYLLAEMKKLIQEALAPPKPVTKEGKSG